MQQSLLLVQNGKLAIEKPESPPRTATPPPNETDHEWEPSHLDSLCVEELNDSSEPSNIVLAADCRRRRRTLRSSRRFTNQYQLVDDHGSLTLKRRVLSYQKVLLLGIHELARPHMQGTLNPSLSLLRFPPELRLRIYRHLLLTGAYYPLFPGVHGFHLQIHLRSEVYYPGDLWPEILATCKLIHREGTPILYGENVFERQFTWPKKRYWTGIPWPKYLTSRLSNTSLSCISTIYISDQDRMWLDDLGELQVFRDFPGLQELRLYISFVSLGPQERAELEARLENILKSIARKPKPLRRCQFLIRLPWDSYWRAWNQNRAEGFIPHQKCKEFVERMMKRNSLFTRQRVTFYYETGLSQWAGPDGSLRFVIEHVGSAGEGSEKPGIHREVNCDGRITHSSVEEDLS